MYQKIHSKTHGGSKLKVFLLKLETAEEMSAITALLFWEVLVNAVRKSKTYNIGKEETTVDIHRWYDL